MATQPTGRCRAHGRGRRQPCVPRTRRNARGACCTRARSCSSPLCSYWLRRGSCGAYALGPHSVHWRYLRWRSWFRSKCSAGPVARGAGLTASCKHTRDGTSSPRWRWHSYSSARRGSVEIQVESAHDDRPAANPPISDDSAHDVRVGTRELLGHCGGVGSENEHGTVGGIGERTSEEQLVPFGRGPRSSICSARNSPRRST